jgi:hypothetical protein
MKLYPLLFLTEAQVFAAEAYKQGYVFVESVFESKRTLVLLDKNQIKDASGALRETGEGIVKGYISFTNPEAGSDVADVRSTSAIKGWGPLLYQAAMKSIQPNWLASDTNLSEDANNVWNKMYEYSNLYERKYIGNLSSDRYECCAFVFNSIPDEDEVATEQSFLAFLKTQNVSPQKTGCFWAYRKLTHEPELDMMIKTGKAVLKAVGNDQILEWVNSTNLP